MAILYLFRGLPGSGKSTAAAKLGCFHVEADMFHVRHGKYNYDPNNRDAGHKFCLHAVMAAMHNGMDVAVSNTFTQLWELEPYIREATRKGYEVNVYHCTGYYGSVHSVPEAILTRMSERWEPYEGEIEYDEVRP